MLDFPIGKCKKSGESGKVFVFFMVPVDATPKRVSARKGISPCVPKSCKSCCQRWDLTLIIKHGNGKYGRFIDELPIRDDDFPSLWLCMLVYWRVVSINSCGFTPDWLGSTGKWWVMLEVSTGSQTWLAGQFPMIYIYISTHIDIDIIYYIYMIFKIKHHLSILIIAFCARHEAEDTRYKHRGSSK